VKILHLSKLSIILDSMKSALQDEPGLKAQLHSRSTKAHDTARTVADLPVDDGTLAPEFGLLPEQWRRIHAVFSDYPEIERVVLYGSRAKGTFRPGSDIDLALNGPALNMKIMNKLATQLDDLLLPYEFDLCEFDHIDNQDLIDHIRRVGKDVYHNDAIRT
jgi:predicted nucleotidyltransferase